MHIEPLECNPTNRDIAGIPRCWTQGRARAASFTFPLNALPTTASSQNARSRCCCPRTSPAGCRYPRIHVLRSHLSIATELYRFETSRTKRPKLQTMYVREWGKGGGQQQWEVFVCLGRNKIDGSVVCTARKIFPLQVHSLQLFCS